MPARRRTTIALLLVAVGLAAALGGVSGIAGSERGNGKAAAPSKGSKPAKPRVQDGNPNDVVDAFAHDVLDPAASSTDKASVRKRAPRKLTTASTAATARMNTGVPTGAYMGRKVGPRGSATSPTWCDVVAGGYLGIAFASPYGPFCYARRLIGNAPGSYTVGIYSFITDRFYPDFQGANNSSFGCVVDAYHHHDGPIRTTTPAKYGRYTYQQRFQFC